MKKVRYRIAACLLIILLSSSVFGEHPYALPLLTAQAAVQISKSKLTVSEDAASKLSISTSQNIVWVSTDTNIATVTSDGTVTGVREGKCSVYGIVGTRAYKCTVTVTKKPKTVLRLSDNILPTPLPLAPSTQKAQPAKTVLTAQNKLSESVSTASKYSTAYSSKKAVAGRTPVYFYHPMRLVLSNPKAEALFYVSSDSNVIRVYSDGAVEAYSEGVADVTAYDKNGNPIETFYLYATTYNDADPIGSKTDYTDNAALLSAYRNIDFQDIQQSLNSITDYVAYLYANNVFYSLEMEGSNPRPLFSGGITWIQSGNSDWIFKNQAGICCNVCAGALYALVGDYERYGTIQLAGKYGHTIYWCYENGTYYVYDFTNIISQGRNYVDEAFSGNIYNYVESTIGRGKTLKAALSDCAKKSNAVYFENNIIYSVELTGLDYYPAEANNWMYTGDFSGTCKAYFVTGTNVELLYTAPGIRFVPQYVDRDKIPNAMRVNIKPTNTEATHTDTNLGRLRTISGTGKTTAPSISLNAGTGRAYTQDKLLKIITPASKLTGSFTASKSKEKRTVVYLYEPVRLQAGSTKAAFWYSSDANVIRVQSDGTVKAYAEGTAEVYAVSRSGKILKTFRLLATTHADTDPLADTIGNGKVEGVIPYFSMRDRNEVSDAVNPYQQIALEDIPDTLHTMTDYTAWILANYAYPNTAEEPQSPRGERTMAADPKAIWFQSANDDCVFTNYTGVCCNYAAAAVWALYGDYEANGLIMMNGSYGHVINWFYENGKYYVIDYMCVSEEREQIRSEFNSDVARYIKERVGIGNSIRTAMEDYMAKNSSRNFYYKNLFMYSTTATGYNFYQSECNTWSSNGIKTADKGKNMLYCSEANTIELFFKSSDNYIFDYEKIAADLIAPNQKTLYSLNVTPYYTPFEQLGSFDNTSMTALEYNTQYGKNFSSSGNSSSGGSETPSFEPGKAFEAEEGTYDIMEYVVYHNYGTYIAYWGIPDGKGYPADYVIPSEIDGLPVTEVSYYALCGKKGLRTLTIPASVTTIDNEAFVGITDIVHFRVYAGSYAEEYCKRNGLSYETISE